MERISRYISYEESVFSHTAINKGIKNIPTKEELDTMEYVAINVFDRVREHFGKPIGVNSFFRSQELNDKITNKVNSKSQHIKGEAIDMDGDKYGVDNLDIFKYIIESDIEFDQIIAEGLGKGKAEWIHVSLRPDGKNRGNILLMKHGDYYTYSEKKLRKLLKS